MVVGVYGELCSSAGCRLPLDVVDRIIYVHSDIDTRLRVRAPPRRIPGSVLRAVAALFVPVAASRAFVDTGKRVASGGAPRALSSVGVSRTWVGLRIIMVFGDVVEERPGEVWHPDSRKCYYIEINTSTYTVQVLAGLHIGGLPSGSGSFNHDGNIWSNCA
jgi:hypothetical protein